jgi:hypothetical protein
MWVWYAGEIEKIRILSEWMIDIILPITDIGSEG